MRKVVSIETVLGGVYFLRDTVKQVLEQINRNRGSRQPVKVFSYENPPIGSPSLGDALTWMLSPFHLQGTKPRPRLRLVGTNPANTRQAPESRLEFPLLDLEIRKRLAVHFEDKQNTDGHFEEMVKGTDECPAPVVPVLTCPDIVILDDLDAMFRKIELLSKAEPEWHAPGRLLENPSYEEQDEEIRKAQLREALTSLFKRFDNAKTEARQVRVPIMEPVILASIKGHPDQCLNREDDPSRNKDEVGLTVWEALLADPWFRERTVVLLDAEDLRESQLAVSTGLSWERTAQDTIAELHRSPRFRKFLDFGQIIVRYGVTGALHVVRRSPIDWSYTLYFDPRRDDTTWAMQDRDGFVLGLTSVFIASLVQALIENCDDHSGNALLGDLSLAIGDAIPSCIQRAEMVSISPAGEMCPNDFMKRIQKREWLPKDLFYRREDQEDADSTSSSARHSIAMTPVPPILLRNWSILSQSAQIRIGRVAQDIVLYGAKSILNQPVTTDAIITARFFDHFATVAARIQFDSQPAGYLALSQAAQDAIIGSWRTRGLEEAVKNVLDDREIFGNRPKSKRWEVLKVVDKLKSLVDQLPLTKIVGRRVSQGEEESHARSIRRAIDTHQNRMMLAEIIDRSSSGDAVTAPLVEFGGQKGGLSGDSMIVVDRREVEGFRAVQNLMRKHIKSVREETNSRPLCIAVFGPPGSGKSTAVKRINESLGDDLTKVLEAYNLAQMTGVQALEDAFEEIGNESSGKKVPIAFFDEFDCGYLDNEKPLGWLKYFLAPMEDGVFNKKKVKNAILVFAGGTSKTFSEFSLADRSRTDPQWIDFSKAKGPDFVSRLRGHLDIVGINPADPDDELYLIRRAILIRAVLSGMQNLKDGDEAKIDDAMLRAVLNVPEFWHGGRAVRMLLELCSTNDNERRISASSVPPINQLNMLVDGKPFLDLLMNVSSAK